MIFIWEVKSVLVSVFFVQLKPFLMTVVLVVFEVKGLLLLICDFIKTYFLQVNKYAKIRKYKFYSITFKLK